MTTANDRERAKEALGRHSDELGSDLYVISDYVRTLEAELNAAKKVIESVYQQSNQPTIIAETREYLNEYGGAQ